MRATVASLILLVSSILSNTSFAQFGPQDYTIDVPLSDVAFNEGYTPVLSLLALHLGEHGKFNVPVIDSSKFVLDDIDFSLTLTLWGAVWTDSSYNPNFSGFIGTYEELDVSGTSAKFTDSSTATSPHGASSLSLIVKFEPNQFLSMDVDPSVFESANVPSDNVTIPIIFGANISVDDAFNSPSNKLDFISGPVLHVTYHFSPIVESYDMSDLPAGGVISDASIRQFSDLPLPDVRLPGSLTPPAGVSIPENRSFASSLIAVLASTLFYVSRRRVRTVLGTWAYPNP